MKVIDSSLDHAPPREYHVGLQPARKAWLGEEYGESAGERAVRVRTMPTVAGPRSLSSEIFGQGT